MPITFADALRSIVVLTAMLMISTADAAELKLLFLGDQGHHRPELRFHDLAPILDKRGIHLVYTDRVHDLNFETLQQFDGLVLYANIDRIDDAPAKAVLDFVASGKGFVALHCASYCWRNNPGLVKLIGGQFLRHGGQVFTTFISEPDHPVMRGFHGFTSWDETYIHHLHNDENRTVLEYRVEGDQSEERDREPWTWIKTHEKGRVFYTAWGHDERTFRHAGFQNLVDRGIRWACGTDPSVVPNFTDPETFSPPTMTDQRKDVAPFEYVDVGPKIPNYTPGTQWGVQGAPRTSMQLPLPSDESLKHFVTPKGFVVRLFADERDFQSKPIAMTWDERGRLWVCETADYPNELGGNRDRIRICEDTDGDLADKFTVFAEGMSIPTAIVLVRGGAVVQNGRETIYLKDIDGDDQADQKTTLITGWALGDTHGGVSNFRYGLDNWIWAIQGYNNSTPEYGGKKIQSFRMGFWRFKLSQTDPPRVTDLEFVRSSNNNSWGIGISEDGLIFGSTANHNPSMFMPIPNRYYEKVRGSAPPTLGTIADSYLFKTITPNVRQVDQFGGYTSGAGHALYTARTFPRQWWNRTAFVCEPTGHLIGTFELRREGANFKSTSPINLLASDDEWCAPIMAEVGPDGAVWVIDWYNYIVQHNPTPQGFQTGKGNAYESDLRDKSHGRIYRVVPTKGDGTNRGDDIVHAVPNLAHATNRQLVQMLKHGSFVWRLKAQQLLIERHTGQSGEIFEALTGMTSDHSIDDIGLNVGAIHALHALRDLGGYGRLDPRLLSASFMQRAISEALRSPSAGVRRNAIAILPSDEHGLNLLLKHSDLFSDRDAQVQLQAFLTLSDMPPGDPAAVEPIVTAAMRTTDSILIDALTTAASVHAFKQLGRLTSAPTEGTNASGASPRLQIARRVAEHVARGKPTAELLATILADIHRADAALQNAILDGLTAGIPANFEFQTTPEFDDALATAFDPSDSAAKSKLVRLAARCGTRALDRHAQEIVQSLLQHLNDKQASADLRLAAARDLVGFRPDDPRIVVAIVGQLNAKTEAELGRAFVQSLLASRSAAVAEQLVAAIPSLTPQLRSSAIGTLLGRPDWANVLLSAIERRELDLTDLSLDQKQALQSFPDASIRQRAEKALAMIGGLPDADRDRVLKSLLHLAEREGSAKDGLEMFKKHCSKCHLHGEIGKNIGPNLTGMAVHPKEELLTHIIDPSRSVEGNFRIYTVVLSDGRVANGMLASETRTSITLIDSEAKEISIQRDDIDEIVASKKSLMPEGFEKQMTEADLTNLLEFLASKGKYVPIPLDRYATAISTKGLFSSGDGGPDRMVFSDWKPKLFRQIPFALTDPQGKSKANIILLNGPRGTLPPTMPKSIVLPCNSAARAIHLLGGVGGWNYPAEAAESVSMIVRLHYADGTSEDHELLNAVHIADYIRRVDVAGSEFAFLLGQQQVRYIAVTPRRPDKIRTIELVKGPDSTAPIVMAVTIERPEK